MNNRFSALVLACFAVFAAACGPQQPVSEPVETPPEAMPATPEFVATELVDALARRDTAAAVKDFDATMKGAMPSAQLDQVWSSLIAQYGSFRSRAGTRTQKVQGFDAVFVTCEFERGSIDLQVTVNNARQVSGLYVRPPSL